MIYISGLFIVGALAMSVRWWLHRYDALGRERRFPAISVSLLVVLAIAAAIPPYLRHNEERKLSSVASQLAGVHATVHCQTFGQTFFEVGGELGYVRYDADGVPEHQTYIRRAPCAALRDYLHSNKSDPTPEEIIAVHVLTHESMHMRGITDEAAAECAAVQRDVTTAELLGADLTEATALAREYWLTDYPRMSPDYRSSDCRPGGAMDERLARAPWNTSPTG